MTLKTLADLYSAPQFKRISWASHPVSMVTEAIKVGFDNKTAASPDKLAVKFYAYNQAVAAIRQKYTLNEVLPDPLAEIVTRYDEELASQAQRLMFYMLLIVCRESRHTKDGDYLLKTPYFSTTYTKETLAYMGNFYNHTFGGSDSLPGNFLKSPPQVELGGFCRCIADMFRKGKFGGGYGGKPWANIADTLASFVTGETTAEMFVDTAYTLAHNNGPMFNKGMYYGMYSKMLLPLLDVQRAGQVIQLVLSPPTHAGVKDFNAIIPFGLREELTKTAIPFFPELEEPVDWIKVHDLGAVSSGVALLAEAQKKAQVHKVAEKSLNFGSPVTFDQEIDLLNGSLGGMPVKIYKRETKK